MTNTNTNRAFGIGVLSIYFTSTHATNTNTNCRTKKSLFACCLAILILAGLYFNFERKLKKSSAHGFPAFVSNGQCHPFRNRNTITIFIVGKSTSSIGCQSTSLMQYFSNYLQFYIDLYSLCRLRSASPF